MDQPYMMIIRRTPEVRGTEIRANSHLTSRETGQAPNGVVGSERRGCGWIVGNPEAIVGRAGPRTCIRRDKSSTPVIHYSATRSNSRSRHPRRGKSTALSLFCSQETAQSLLGGFAKRPRWKSAVISYLYSRFFAASLPRWP